MNPWRRASRCALVVAVAVTACQARETTGVVSPDEAMLTVVDGSGQVAVANSPAAVPMTVKAEDRAGAPVPGVVVTWTVTSGSGNVAPPTATTGADGLASTAFVAGTAQGPAVVTASATGFASASVQVTVILSGPPTPSVLSMVSGDAQLVRTGTTAPIAFTADVRDRFGVGVSMVQIVWMIEQGGGILSADVTETDITGRASTIYTAGTTTGTSLITATVAGLAPLRFTVTVMATAGQSER